ncbi:TPA: hypothetical protein I9Z31_000963 [Clostridium perfringens]|nr:hypothetical protein [Clostridium perfringens]EJT6613120.1 hypothetical protein [Clostridium perfringens]MDU2662112.1 hypothetical protein [Clostridioides difficile]HAT4103562.1 hypothetical protein [Clostridium perfringens]
MNQVYKVIPSILKKSDILSKKSFSSKDYVTLVPVNKSVKLKDMVDYKTGDSFLRGDFITPDVSKKYRYIRTGNISQYRILLNLNPVQYCKPRGSNDLLDGDILVAKDGGSSGLGEVSFYIKTDSDITDYFCGEILRLRVNSEYNKWYILAVLKSKYFKDYLDIVTPGGSTLRHSKLLALNFELPYDEDTRKEDIEYIGKLMQNLIHKERTLEKKVKEIDNIFDCEINGQFSINTDNSKIYPKISKIKEINRLDTGAYMGEYVVLEEKVKNYRGGYYYIPIESISPGKTPPDYKYTDNKLFNTFLWITPKNLNPKELIFKTYINTKEKTKVSDYSVIISAIRYLGNGYFVDKGEIVYCNQNTLIINYSNDIKEQIYLLAFLTSEIGKKLQMAWRVDGMVPILYREDLSKIPIPKIQDDTKMKICGLYYNECKVNENVNRENYLDIVKDRNSKLGIYQLNSEILYLKTKINQLVDNIIMNTTIECNYNVM